MIINRPDFIPMEFELLLAEADATLHHCSTSKQMFLCIVVAVSPELHSLCNFQYIKQYRKGTAMTIHAIRTGF